VLLCCNRCFVRPGLIFLSHLDLMKNGFELFLLPLIEHAFSQRLCCHLCPRLCSLDGVDTHDVIGVSSEERGSIR